MISQNIQQQINEAMKAGDRVRVETLKMLSAEYHRAEIDKGLNAQLTEEEDLAVIQKEVKKRKDAIEAYQNAVGIKEGEAKQRAQQNLEKEQTELAILEEYLPEQLSDQELDLLVDKSIALVGAGNIQDMGRVIGKAMELSQGRSDGKRISEIVRQKLI